MMRRSSADVHRSVGIDPPVAAVLGDNDRASQLERLTRALERRSAAILAVGEIGMVCVAERRAGYRAQT